MGFLRFAALFVIPFLLVGRAIRFMFVAAGALFVFGFVLLGIIMRYKKAYFFFALTAYAGINFSAQQPIFLAAAEFYVSTFETFYNELVVDTLNSVFDCFTPIREWYNLTIAFAQAILARIANRFGLDLFTFALRDVPRNAEPVPPLDPETLQLVEECMGELPKERVILQIIQTLCDILDFVAGFLVAVLGIFTDFMLFVMDVVLDFFKASLSLDFSFPKLFMTVAFTVLVQFIDPLGCFTPISSLPWNLFVCLCPHRYNGQSDLPSPRWLAPIGCICPIDGKTDPIEVLFSCFDGPVLQFLLRAIEVLINVLRTLLDTARSVYFAIRGVVNTIQGLNATLNRLISSVRSVICSIPFVDCRMVTEQVLEPGAPNMYGVRPMVLYNVTTLYITGDINDTVTFREPADPNYLQSQLDDLDKIGREIDFYASLLEIRHNPIMPTFTFPPMNDSIRAAEFKVPSIQEAVHEFKQYTQIGRNSAFGALFMRHLEHMATATSPRLTSSEEAQRTFLTHGSSLLRLYFEAVSRMHDGHHADVHWFLREFDERGIDINQFADAAIESMSDSSGFGRKAQEAVARSALRTRAILHPSTLADSVARVLHKSPWLRAEVHAELRNITMEIRAAREKPVAQRFYHEPTPAEKSNDPRAVVVIGLSLVGLGAVVFSIQIGLLALPILVPFLAVALLALVTFFLLFINIAAEISSGILTTIVTGGVIKGIDLLAPWALMLGDFLLVGFTRPYVPADIFVILSRSQSIARTEIEHIALLVIRQFLCTVPRPGITDSCPPLPPYNPNDGLPTMGIAEWIRALLEANPEGQCFVVEDCAGLAKGCRCPDGRLAAEESPCTAVGICETWPYMNSDGRLQRLDLQIDLDVECEDLGWKFRDLGWWSQTPWMEWLMLVNQSGFRSLRYVLNSLSGGIAIPWYTLTIGLLGVLPIVNLLAKTTVWSVVILNLASFATVGASTWILTAIAPFGGAFPFNEVRDLIVFPNSAGGMDKGSVTPGENTCFVTCFPQFMMFLLIWMTVILLVFAFAAGPLLVALYGFVRYVLLGWVDFATYSGGLVFGAALDNSAKNLEKQDGIRRRRRKMY